MIRQLKTITARVIGLVNILVVALMLAVGYSSYVDPLAHPLLSCLGITFPFFLATNLAFLFFWLLFKRKYALIPIIGYALAYVPIRVYMPLNVWSEESSTDVIKVLSYNVMSYSGTPRYNNSFDMIYDYIAQNNADIVCLQEANDSWRSSLVRFGELYEYVDTTDVGSGTRNVLALLSRYPIIRKERIDYPSRGNGSMAYYLRRDDDTLLVINNHLETNHFTTLERERYKEMIKGEMENDTARAESKKIIHKLRNAVLLRAPQANAVHKYIEMHRDYPIIVCGDFNDNPVSYSHRIIASGLTDCFVSTGTGLGISYNQKGFYVRIDNIMCSKEITPYDCKVDAGIDASDHYPIYCYLSIKNKP